MRFVEDGWTYEGREGRSSRCHVNSLVDELIDCSIVDGIFCFFFPAHWDVAVGYRSTVGHARAFRYYMRAAAWPLLGKQVS